MTEAIGEWSTAIEEEQQTASTATTTKRCTPMCEPSLQVTTTKVFLSIISISNEMKTFGKAKHTADAKNAKNASSKYAWI